MKLFEYMAKEVFQEYEIPTPRGRVATSPKEAEDIARELDCPAVLKVQVLAGGRGKAGGVQFADDPQEARAVAAELLSMQIHGHEVERVLVEEKLDIDQEIYLGMTIDPGDRCPILIASSRGGVSIEEVPDRYIVRERIPMQWGLYPYQMRAVAERMELAGKLARDFGNIAIALYRLFRDRDAELTEINPLVVSGDRMLAADARLNVDEDSEFRHELPVTERLSEVEERVAEIGLSYVQLDGDVAVLANGAGATMATMDILQQYDSDAMNFLDVGGGADVDSMTEALRVLADTEPRVLLVNIFGGITRCDDVAEAVLRVKREGTFRSPLVVRLIGTNEEQGIQLLEEEGITALRNLEDAARAAAQTAASDGAEEE